MVFNNNIHYGIPLTWNNCVRRRDNNYTCIINFSFDLLKKNVVNTISKLLFNHQFNREKIKFININAWNEWNEQAVLEPSTLYGYQILNLFHNIISNL